MEPTQNNTPHEPKKSFWQKLFGGGDKPATPSVTPPAEPVVPVPPVNNDFSNPSANNSSFTPSPGTAGNDISRPGFSSTPPAPSSGASTLEEVTPQDTAAVDAALNDLPSVDAPVATTSTPLSSSWSSPSSSATSAHDIPPVPPSDPMVTPAPALPQNDVTSNIPEEKPAPQAWSPESETTVPSEDTAAPSGPIATSDNDSDTRPPLTPPAV